MILILEKLEFELEKLELELEKLQFELVKQNLSLSLENLLMTDSSTSNQTRPQNLFKLQGVFFGLKSLNFELEHIPKYWNFVASNNNPPNYYQVLTQLCPLELRLLMSAKEVSCSASIGMPDLLSF